MPNLCRRWALAALVVLMAVVAGGCFDADMDSGTDFDNGLLGAFGFNPDGTPKEGQAPICYPAPAAQANAGAPAPGPVCFHF